MEEIEDDDLLKIINHYGVDHQLKYFQSEVFELNEVIIKNEHNKQYQFDGLNKNYYTAEITEELADCIVMLSQFANYYGIHAEEIIEVAQGKIKRQLERIKEEKK